MSCGARRDLALESDLVLSSSSVTIVTDVKDLQDFIAFFVFLPRPCNASPLTPRIEHVDRLFGLLLRK
jgi:hypothetical protein